MDNNTNLNEHIELFSIIKDKLNQIPDRTIEWSEGESDNAKFVFIQYLKVVIDQESDKWIKQYVE